MQSWPHVACALFFGAVLASSTTIDAAAAPDALVTRLENGNADAGGDIERLCARMFTSVAKPRIEFYRSSSTLRSSSYAALDRLVSFARDCPRGIIRISAHTDGTGDPEFNVLLSRQRAAAVADYLRSAGVPAARLQTVGKGSSEPIADEATARGRARNRRVEFALLDSRS